MNAYCKSVKIDGSLVSTKLLPEDFDGTLDPEVVNDKVIDQIMLDINNIIDDNKYKGELYPAYYIEKNSKMFWDDYFQTDCEDNIKGIVQIDLGTLP